MTTPGAVKAVGLAKQYPGMPSAALDGVSIELAPGETLGVVGENGSGKSTLLDLLCGFTSVSAGSLEVGGPVASLLELGAGLFQELTGHDNAVQVALLEGRSPSEAREFARATNAFAELGEFFDRPVRTYSAGMGVRLGFAVAVGTRAPVTIVDEVLAVGDGYFQRKCVDALVAMRDSGTTLVVASHDLHAVRSLCRRALWLRGGRVEAVGPADEVVGRYEEHLRLRSASSQLTPGRHGTGEVRIESVRLCDAAGHARSEFRTGDALRVEIVFETAAALESPTMGVALFRADGVYCAGPNTRFDGVLTGPYEGRYKLVAEFAELPLLGGDYEASVSFYDKDHVYAYAWDHRLYPFRIVSDRADHGLVAMRHRFTVERV